MGAPVGPRKYDADKHCGARTKSDAPGRTKGKPCTRAKGERTNHPGQGRCWLHGGGSISLTGIYATTQSIVLREAIKKIRESGIDPMDLSPEAELLRALVTTFVDRHELLQVQLNTWHESWQEPYKAILNPQSTPEEIERAIADLRSVTTAHRPRRDPVDLESASRLASEVGKMVERIHKIKQTSAVTFEAVHLLLERMGLVLLKHVKDKDVVDAITRDWNELEIPTTAVRT